MCREGLGAREWLHKAAMDKYGVENLSYKDESTLPQREAKLRIFYIYSVCINLCSCMN